MTRRVEAVLWVAVAAVAVAVAAGFWGFSYDDAFITYRYARSFAETGELAYQAGEATGGGHAVYGTTAPGYALLLGALARLTPIGIPEWGTLLSVLSLLVPPLALRWALGGGSEVRGRPWARALLPPAFALLLLTSRWNVEMLGSESLAATAAAAAGMVVLFRGEREVSAGLLFALATCFRLDAALAAGAAALVRWAATRRFPWRLALAGTLPVVPYLAFLELHFGQVLPATLAAKSEALARAPRGYTGAEWAWLRRTLPLPGALALLGLAGLGEIAVVRCGLLRRPLPAAVALWILVHELAYRVIGVAFAPWYHVATLAALLLLALGGARMIAGAGAQWRLAPAPQHRRPASRSQRPHDDAETSAAEGRSRSCDDLAAPTSDGPGRDHRTAAGEGVASPAAESRPARPPHRGPSLSLSAARVVSFIALLPILLPGAAWTARTFGTPPDPRYPLYATIGRWVAAHSAPDAAVAAAEIGFLGWESRRRVVDLVGLVSPGALAAREAGEPAEWLLRERPRFVVDPPRFRATGDGEFLGHPTIVARYRVRATFRSPSFGAETVRLLELREGPRRPGPYGKIPAARAPARRRPPAAGGLPDEHPRRPPPMTTVPVKEHIARGAHVSSLDDYGEAYRRSLDDPDGFWREQAERLTWFHDFYTVGDWDMARPDVSWFGGGRPDVAWFAGGRLNACFNCVDRHVATRPDKTAIVWAKDEPGEYERISYRELKHEVARLANVLLAHGVGRGDRVAIYLPMVPELAYAMLACARIGAIHSVVFAGFSAQSLKDRILDAGARLVITADEGLRGGKRIPLKRTVDEAIEGLTVVERVLVVARTGAEVPMRSGRDLWLADEEARQRSTCPVEWMASESPLFILYTSGSTGKPKGVLHTTAGYLLFAAMTHELVFDLRPDDVYMCAADVGWITGHSYIVYGPLANGATTVMFESTPVYPDASRYWRVVDDLGVTIFYTAPTAIRAIAREGDEAVRRHSRSTLRVLGTVGEPINPEVWQWYHDVVGDGRCAVVDTWWQTETGGIMITPLPGATPAKPGSATLPFYGVEPVLVDDEGNRLEGNDVRGNLCIARPWPGQARTIYGDHQRFRETYFTRFSGLYFTGDGCWRDPDGYYWITGRVDDVLNVSGHRLGTAEIESALVSHDAVAEAAVVGFPHEIKGTGIFAYVDVVPDRRGDDPEELAGALKEHVRHEIGPIASPDRVQVVSGLPKTRSGKIMRRILRQIAAGEYEELGDVTTLADPGVVVALVEEHRRASGG